MTLSLCSFAIETTLPLSNFKTKHIFGILIARDKFLKPFGAPKAPHFFCYRRHPEWGAPNFFLILFFTAAEGGDFPNGRCFPGG